MITCTTCGTMYERSHSCITTYPSNNFQTFIDPHTALYIRIAETLERIAVALEKGTKKDVITRGE